MDAILAIPAGASGQEDGFTLVGGDGMVTPRAELLDGNDFPRLATPEKQGSDDDVDLDLGDEEGGGGVVDDGDSRPAVPLAVAGGLRGVAEDQAFVVQHARGDASAVMAKAIGVFSRSPLCPVLMVRGQHGKELVCSMPSAASQGVARDLLVQVSQMKVTVTRFGE